MRQLSNSFIKRSVLLICSLFLFPSSSRSSTNMDHEYNLAQQFGENAKKSVETTSQSQTGTAQVPGYDNSAAHRKAEELKHADLSQQSIVEKRNNAAAQSVEISEKERIQYKHIEKEPLVTGSQAITDNPEKILKNTYKDCREVVVEDRRSEKEETKTCEESGDPQHIPCSIRRIITYTKPAPQKHHLHVSVYNHGQSGMLMRNVLTGQQLDGIYTVSGGGFAAWTSVSNPFPAHLGSRIRSKRILSGNQYNCMSLEGDVLKASPTGFGRFGNWQWLNTTVVIEIEYDPLPTLANLSERIEDQCLALEEKADQGLCSYGSERLIDGPGQKNFETLIVSRDWWHKERIYHCGYPSKNDCEDLRNHGCEQQSAACKTWQSGRCVEFVKSFLCRSYTLKEGAPFKTKLICGDTPYCLTGDCLNSSYDPNDEMGQALAQLSIFNQIQKKLTKDSLKIFEGDKAWCHKDMLSFCDCCGHGKGWGMSLNMARCSGDEKILAEKRQKNLCHQIGTYCVHKNALGFCEKKRTTFCCFGSRLIRTIQEQGRVQLDKGWGNAQQPNCDAFTIDEFVKIDFSKLDLSEFIQEVVASCKKLDLSRLTDKVQERVEQMQRSLDKGGK